MYKKGQIQISFGFIFSVIIIAATLAVAIYVIWAFLKIDEKAECALFKDDLQKQIDKIWGADVDSSYPFSHTVAPKTTYVCFGLKSQSLENSAQQKMYDEIKKYSDSKSNMHFYPVDSCGKGASRYTLNHVNTTSFFCVETPKGKADFKLTKGSFDSVVKVCQTNSQNCGTPLTSTGSNPNSRTPPTSGTPTTPAASGNYSDINVCKRAESASICNGLEISYDNIYKGKCCSEHRICC